MKKNPIVVYWSTIDNSRTNPTLDLSYLYHEPTNLFADIKSRRVESLPKNSYFACPAVSNKFKKTLVFKNSVSCEYIYSFEDETRIIAPTTEGFIPVYEFRDDAIIDGPTIEFAMGNIFFAEESLDINFTPPYFHKPQYMKEASIMPGGFDVGQWFRPYNLELQFWQKSGTFSFQEDEPLFYAEFLTNRPVILKKFVMNEPLIKYMNSTVASTELFGKGQTLLSRYTKFKNVGLRDKILLEIKKNLVEADPIKL